MERAISRPHSIEPQSRPATVDIQNRVNTAQGRLPAAVKAIGITTAKSSQDFVFGAAVIADKTNIPRCS